VCRYSGVGAGGAGSTLEHAKVVTGPGLRALVALLDSPRWSVVAPSAVYSCPNWDGAADVGLFVYAIGPSVRVTVDLGGCGFASNGVRTVQGTGIAGQLAASVGS
jgi:hypothetical protein